MKEKERESETRGKIDENYFSSFQVGLGNEKKRSSYIDNKRTFF